MIRFPPQRILVGMDFSEPSVSAWRHAAAWARKTGAHLKVVHAADPLPLEIPGVPQVPGGNEAFFADAAAGLRRATGGADVEVLEGSPMVVLLRRARDWKADLLVLGTHGRAGVERVLLGSVAEAMFRDAQLPVLAVHRDPTPIRSVLAPFNGARYAEEALHYAAAVAADLGARLTVHWAIGATPDGGGARGLLAEAIRRLPAFVREACEPRVLVTRGTAADAIAGAAGRHDLVVLSAHRRGLLGSILGPTCARVLRSSSTALLAVPPVGAHGRLRLERWQTREAI